MRLRTFLPTLLLFLITSITASAQQPIGHLTIFSEDGDKFTLFLNGEQINTEPQVNIRVEDLNQPYYNVKVVFADQAKEALSKNRVTIIDPDGIYMDVTYKMKRDKNNASKMKLNFFSVTPVDQAYVCPSNVYLRHWGKPEPQQVVVVQQAPAGTVTQTTTTTTTAGTGTNAAIGVNVNGVGVGMNVNINDGMPAGTTVSQTTTTTTSSSSGGERRNDREPEQSRDACYKNRPMSGDNFSNALATIKKISFDETRLSTAKQISKSNCLSPNQIVQICEQFSFEETKLDFAKFAYDRCTDPKNYFTVNNIFTFSSNVESLTNYINARTPH